MAAGETRIITKRMHDRPDDSWTIDAAVATGSYDGLRKALTMSGDHGWITIAVSRTGAAEEEAPTLSSFLTPWSMR